MVTNLQMVSSLIQSLLLSRAKLFVTPIALFEEITLGVQPLRKLYCLCCSYEVVLYSEPLDKLMENGS